MQKPNELAGYSKLTAAWFDRFGTPPPKNLSRRLLSHALAYEDQAAQHGGLRRQTKKQLIQFANTSILLPPTRGLSAGTRLVREWNGNIYVVDVIDGGFRMDSREFRSLSAVAKAITGAHWSGAAFFGLVRRRQKSDRELRRTSINEEDNHSRAENGR